MVATSQPRASLLGVQVGGYEVLELIGVGAVGTVYLAKDLNLERFAALKVLLGNAAQDPKAVSVFHREAQIAALLKHPNIVRVYAAGIENGAPYIAMEYVFGEGVDRFLQRQRAIPWQSAFQIGEQAAKALSCAHKYGIVHCDVKPGNLLLDSHGRVRLTDFGAADVSAVDPNGPRRKQDLSKLIGTPHYLSPEQCNGKPLWAGTDLFALGVSLYQMIAGELPFKAERPVELVQAICTHNPPRLNRLVPGVPDDVARLVAHLLEKDPKDRLGDARVAAERMESLQIEGGGKSTWHTTLEAFRNEQDDIRLHHEPPKPSVAVRKAKARSSAGWRLPSLRSMLPATATVVVFLLCVTAGFLLGAHRPPVLDKAPALDRACFEEIGSEGIRFRLDAPAFEMGNLAWVGDRRKVAIEVRGIDGSPADGAWGLLTVEPESRRVLMPRAPVNTVLTPEPYLCSGLTPTLATVPPVPPGALLHEAVPVYALQEQEDSVRLLVLAHPLDRAGPRRQTLYRSPVVACDGPLAVQSGRFSPVHAVARPDGRAVCLVLDDPVLGGNYLVEQQLPLGPDAKPGAPVTRVGSAIIPESVRYAPDSDRLLFMRQAGPRRDLCLVFLAGEDTGEVRLASGSLGDCAAFSPDGWHVAFDRRVAHGRDHEVCLVSIDSPTVTARLGLGRVGREPWDPDGAFLVVVSAEEGSHQQAWAVETAAPHRRVPLTNEPAGVRAGCAVSRRGTWLAAVVAGNGPPRAVFMSLAEVPARLAGEVNTQG